MMAADCVDVTLVFSGAVRHCNVTSVTCSVFLNGILLSLCRLCTACDAVTPAQSPYMFSLTAGGVQLIRVFCSNITSLQTWQ